MNIEQISVGIAETIESFNQHVFRIEGTDVRRSGVVVDGYVVTAAHGLDSDEDLEAHSSDGQKTALDPVGIDRRLDLAVFKPGIESPGAPIHGDDGLKVGNLVFALGRPGMSLRAAFGMISVAADEFRGPTGVRFKPYIEVDGSLPRGFSGGPLLSHKGLMIGMNTSVPRGLGMTVPVENLRESIERIKTGKTAKIGYLGVNTSQAKLEDGETGLVITGVDPDSPAAGAKLGAGDIILSADGDPISSQGALYHMLLEGPREVVLIVQRAGSRHEVRLTLSERQHG
jgi:S1-C subfamily serine protease